jgi:hypothetical protein
MRRRSASPRPCSASAGGERTHHDLSSIASDHGLPFRHGVQRTIWQGTPLGWALHGGGARQAEMAQCLRALGATQ